MRLIQTVLPTAEGDNRVATFFESLHRNMSHLTILPGQVDFYESGEIGIPTENGSREKLSDEALVVLVYELRFADSVTLAIRTALAETWPEREDLQVIETAMRDGHNFGVIRGDKQ